ncbi:MAG TPA: hypothetical protein VGB52_05310 [Actinomycetota bacterium]
MGARTSDTLKEIEQIRARLDVRFAELERRLPPIARRGRQAVRLLGGGVGAGVALFVARRIAGRTRRTTKRRAEGQVTPPAIVVHSGIGAPAAIAVAAVWAGVRIYEARRAPGAAAGADVVPLPGRRRA